MIIDMIKTETFGTIFMAYVYLNALWAYLGIILFFVYFENELENEGFKIKHILILLFFIVPNLIILLIIGLIVLIKKIYFSTKLFTLRRILDKTIIKNK